MKYRLLGNTGVHVSELCLGAMTFGSRWEAIGALGQAEADALVGRSMEAGVNFFDTADVYSAGESEEILGRAALTAEELARLDDVSRLPPGYPHWMTALGDDREPGQSRDLEARLRK